MTSRHRAPSIDQVAAARAQRTLLKKLKRPVPPDVEEMANATPRSGDDSDDPSHPAAHRGDQMPPRVTEAPAERPADLQAALEELGYHGGEVMAIVESERPADNHEIAAELFAHLERIADIYQDLILGEGEAGLQYVETGMDVKSSPELAGDDDLTRWAPKVLRSVDPDIAHLVLTIEQWSQDAVGAGVIDEDEGERISRAAYGLAASGADSARLRAFQREVLETLDRQRSMAGLPMDVSPAVVTGTVADVLDVQRDHSITEAELDVISRHEYEQLDAKARGQITLPEVEATEAAESSHQW